MTNVYGSYDIQTGRSYQVKKPVTDRVILNHLQGKRPYGVYLLVKDKIRAITSDFDIENPLIPMEFFSAAKHYRLDAYIERSKSKGYHVWIFFEKGGVLAQKARLIVRHILEEIEYPDTEIFPKQDTLIGNRRFGNFINAPLFGTLVPKGKTVFIDPKTFEPYTNQWEFFESVTKTSESLLDDIIELNDLSKKIKDVPKQSAFEEKRNNSYVLPVCAQRMLRDGVKQYQRDSCFRLSVHLKRVGLPSDLAIAALKVWALKNQPDLGKQIITEPEILDQASSAFSKDYRGYGCSTMAVAPFCDQACPVNKLRMQN